MDVSETRLATSGIDTSRSRAISSSSGARVVPLQDAAKEARQAAAINAEVETYNELLPHPGELSATLLIEYAEPIERDAELVRLVGLERHLWMVLDGRRIGARFDERQMSPDQISAVQFIAFPLGADADRFGELAAAGKVAIEVDHPHLSLRVPIEGPLATALADDLGPD